MGGGAPKASCVAASSLVYCRQAGVSGERTQMRRGGERAGGGGAARAHVDLAAEQLLHDLDHDDLEAVRQLQTGSGGYHAGQTGPAAAGRGGTPAGKDPWRRRTTLDRVAISSSSQSGACGRVSQSLRRRGRAGRR